MNTRSQQADNATNTTTICSVPYAIDDNASEDSSANAANLVNLCSSFSADFNGFPTNNLLSNPISMLLYTPFPLRITGVIFYSKQDVIVRP